MSDTARIVQTLLFVVLMGGLFWSINTVLSPRGTGYWKVWYSTLGIGIIGLMFWLVGLIIYPNGPSLAWTFGEIFAASVQIIYTWFANHTTYLQW